MRNEDNQRCFQLTAKRVSREQELHSTCKPFVEPDFTYSLVG